MPPGCKVIIHDRHMEQNAWDEHGTPGFYIKITPQHYQNQQCYIPKTIKTHISNTFQFLPAYFQLSMITPLDRFTMAVEDLVEAQRSPYFHKLAAESGIPENIASKNIQAAWGIPQEPNKKYIAVPLSTSKSDGRTRSQSKSITEQVYKPGTILRKDFKKHG